MKKSYSNFRNQIKTILGFSLLFTLLFFSTNTANAQAFRTTWVTTDGTITIPTNASSGIYNYDITWTNLTNAGIGDGSVTGQTGDYTITGLEYNNIYEIAITGDFPHFYMPYSSDPSKLRTIEAWGNIMWTNMSYAFSNCTFLTYNATDIPDLNRVTNLSYMFAACTNFNGDIGNWNTQNVIGMSGMFEQATAFNQDIGNWDTQNVTNMSDMFSGASSFNQNIGNWNTQNVTNMSSMFLDATAFNQNIGNWNTHNVIDMSYMFLRASSFNQNIENWNTQNVTNMIGMFYQAVSFNQDIGNWNTQNVINMSSMFQRASSFNGSIGNWNTQNVTDMYAMFRNASSFNQPIGNWNTQSVTNMQSMFSEAISFNQDIGNWNTQNVTNMSDMFYAVSSFNQNIGSWNMTAVTNMSSMFQRASSFNQDIGNWNTQNVTDMSNMFGQATAFNQDIGNWNTQNVISMSHMFSGARTFNQDIGNWNTQNVISMSGMFQQAISFNQNIGNWNTQNVTDMSGMFNLTGSFNQNIGNWNTTAVTNMSLMFSHTSFNQPIGNWNTQNVTDMSNMFQRASSFNQNIGNWDIRNVTTMNNMLTESALNRSNYDSTLIGWAAQNVQSNVSLGATGLTYCRAVVARNRLTSAPNNWIITGDLQNLGVSISNITLPQNQYGLCVNTQTILEANGMGTIYWYDSPISNISIHTGSSFTTPILTADSTYFYVQDSSLSCGSSNRLEILVTTSQVLNVVSKNNYTAYLDNTGQIEVNAVLLDSISSAGCGNTITSYLFDDTSLATRSFSCVDTNAVHNVILRVTDNQGNTETSPTIIHVKDIIPPIVSVRILPVIFNASNQATILARDFITSLRDNCTDSAYINVVFNDTGLESKFFDCGNNSIRSLTLRITDRAGNQVIQPVSINHSAINYDFNVNIIGGTFRPAIISTITVLANNYSCAPKSGELKVTLPSNVTYISSSITPNRIVGNDLFWNVTDLNFDRSFVTRIQIRPNNNVNIGDEVCFTGHITPETSDITRLNNLKSYCFPIVNSYDPNDKQVYPQGICTDKFTKRSDLPLTYTIRFQNTGNAPALNVRIADSLSSLLNRRSLRVVGSSHPMVVDTTANNNVINFRFNNINLPDSASNPEGSQGYVIFELSEIAAHTDTSRISNKSYIYFDTNAPIITNTVKNTIVNTLPLCSPTNPNPPIADCQLPTNLRTEILSSTRVKLLWTTPANTNAINYEILRNGQRLNTVPASNLSYIDSTLTANTQYNYSIKAICGNNNATSNSVQVRTLPATPILLSVVAACKGEKGRINVQSAGAVYRVYSSQTSTNPLFETNNASIETPILTDSTTFYISVVINGQESQRLKAVVPIKEVFDAVVEQGSLLESCATNFTLSAQAVEGATYTWFRENVQVGTERTLITTFEARYKVRVIKNGCSDESEFTTTRFVSAPTAKIQQGNTVSFCGSGTLNAQDTSANVTYEWILNGNVIKTGTSVSVSESGTYTLKASQPSCESSVTIAVTITTAPANVALTADKTAICSDSETILSATTGTGFTYKWFRNNTAISNTSATLSTSELGNYKVEITTAEGCKVTTSETEITRLQVNQAILRVNTESGRDKTIDVTSQDAIESVKWFKDGVEIPAFANQNLITPTETGNYKAKVVYETGCSFETAEKTFTVGGITGIEEESAKIFTIYPNPNNGSFKVEFATTTNQKTTLTLVDALGRIIHSQEIVMNEKSLAISLPKISAGVYVVQIISEGKVYTKQLIIQ